MTREEEMKRWEMFFDSCRKYIHGPFKESDERAAKERLESYECAKKEFSDYERRRA